MTELRALQRSLWSVLTDPLGASEVLASAGNHAWLQGVVRSDAVAPARARLEVYANMYFCRLRDNLAADFPRLAGALGAHAFDRVVADYLEAHPSRHPSVRHLGRTLAQFLRARPSPCPWLADLAALEWTRLDVFDREDEPTLTQAQLGEAATRGFAGLHLAAITAHAQVPATHDVRALWRTPESGIAPPRTRGTLLVWRQPNHAVHHRLLDAEEAELLTLLAQGLDFTALCARVSAERSPEAAALHALALVSTWTATGLLRAH